MSLLERAETAQKALFGRYDQLNEKWEAAEKRLRSLHVPRPVWVCIRETDTDPDQPGCRIEREYLGLTRYRGDWRICYDSWYEPNDQYSGEKPITECSAELRVFAVAFLPKLHEAIVKSAEDFIPEVDKALSRLDAYLS